MRGLEHKDTSDNADSGTGVGERNSGSDLVSFVHASEEAGSADPLPLDAATPPLPPLPLFDPAFPLESFLRACARYESMRARRRRWELIKQWDTLFTSYRRDGWERDNFCLPGTTWAVRGGAYQCQCEGKL